MKKNILKIIVTIIFVFLFSSIINAKIVTVYQSIDPVEISTKIGTATTMIFPVEIQIAIPGSQTAFQVQEDVNNNKIIIFPLKTGVWTNLTVIDNNDNQYIFKLIENNSNDYYDLVNVKTKENMPYSTIIKIINNEKNYVDPDILKLVDLYDIDNYSVKNEIIEIEIKRAAIINNTDETVYWLKIHNISEKSIIINTLGVKERNPKAIITENDYIKPENYGDYFIINQGRLKDNKLTINLTINNKEYEIVLEDIPYISKNFTVYEIN